MPDHIILAIESSCDETAISILKSTGSSMELLCNEISSQVKLHAKWGGVVPNLAAREHVKNITHLLDLSLEKAGIEAKDIDALAVTQGPGLIPALMVGVNFAKTLAYLWEKPLIGIHHIEGHIYANFISDKISVSNNNQETNAKQISKSKFQISNSLAANKLMKLKANEAEIEFPILCLVVSGGHTQLVLMKDHLKYEIIGQTLDDAVGEAFDKVARILGIGYPGGPAVAKHAEKYKNLKANEPESYKLVFPRPMINKKNFDFSFSGLKTAVLYETKKNPELLKDEKYIAEICHEFQQAAIDVLISKTLKAAKQFNPKTIMLAGGVSANKELREQLGSAIENYNQSNQFNVSYIIPDLSLTGDNAAMIAAAAAFRWEKMSETQKKKAMSNWKTLQPDANLKLK